VNLTANASVPSSAKLKLDFLYDHRSHRTSKTLSTWNGSAYVGQSTNKFFYDDWNLAAEVNHTNGPVRSYVWGLDLSGSLQGAGGVGGLLLLNVATSNTQHFVTFDGNGNVSALVNTTNGALSAQYEYGPFGEVIRSTGIMAKTTPFGFSTKYRDDETDLLYYGYRYLSTVTARWTCRDSIGEEGFRNLNGTDTWLSDNVTGKKAGKISSQQLEPPFLFVRNAPCNSFDLLGLLVEGLLDTSRNTLTVTDKDTGKSVTVVAFTGGKADAQCNVTVGTADTGEVPAPNGQYIIGPDPKSKAGWFGLFRNDGRIDDYFTDQGKKRSGVRLHLGTWSQGCVTVCMHQPDAKKKWEDLVSLITGTKTEQIDFIDGPHFWNKTKKITKYGTLVVK